jgi:hypothetical protein
MLPRVRNGSIKMPWVLLRCMKRGQLKQGVRKEFDLRLLAVGFRSEGLP